MEPLTLFAFGYEGWGSTTAQLVEAIDKVEASRGFGPPVFVDVRLAREVRAKGFAGKAFETLLGKPRYRWIPDLGNPGVKEGGDTRIKNPAAASLLLELAESLSAARQRVVFFCHCMPPLAEGAPGCCHRTLVGGLLLRAAKKRGLAVRIDEWPGGAARFTGIDVPVSGNDYERIRLGKLKSVPLQGQPAVQLLALPWYSLIRLESGGEYSPWCVVTGPARVKKSGWYLPVYGGGPPDKIRPHVLGFRVESGFEGRLS